MGDTGGSVISLIGRGVCMCISRDIRILLFVGIGGPSAPPPPIAAPGTGASSSAGFLKLAL